MKTENYFIETIFGKNNNMTKSKTINKLLDENNDEFLNKILMYFKKEYPNKKFSIKTIKESYYDLTDNNHIDNIYELIKW